MTRTCRLVVDGAVSSALSTLLTQWESKKQGEGWSVQQRIVTDGLTAPAIRDILLSAKTDHAFLIGDNVPYLACWSNPDGHVNRPDLADHLFVTPGTLIYDAQGYVLGGWGQTTGCIGRLYYGKQSLLAGETTIDLYRKYLLRCLRWPAIESEYLDVVAYDGHLDYGGFVGIGQSARTQIPAGKFENITPNGPIISGDTDQAFSFLSTHSALFAVLLDGGQVENPGGFVNIGSPALWRQFDPKVAICIGFGSYACEVLWKDSFLTAVTTGSHCLAGVYDPWGWFPYGGMYAGKTLGECGRDMITVQGANNTTLLCSIEGDPTLALTEDTQVIAVAALQEDMTKAKADIATLKIQVAGLLAAPVQVITPVVPVVPSTPVVAIVPGSPTFDQVNAAYLKYLGRPASIGEYQGNWSHQPNYDYYISVSDEAKRYSQKQITIATTGA